MKFRYLLPSVLWSLIILWIISIPGTSIPSSKLFDIPHFDKLVHAAVFAVFTFLLTYGLRMQQIIVLNKYPYTISLLVGVVYSMLTEWIQLRFVDSRSGELYDLIADLAGCLMGVLLYYYLNRYFPSFLHK